MTANYSSLIAHDSLDQTLRLYLEQEARGFALLSSSEVRTVLTHKSGIGRRYCYHVIGNGTKLIDIFSKQYSSEEYAKSELEVLSDINLRADGDISVSSLSPLSRHGSTIFFPKISGVDLAAMLHTRRDPKAVVNELFFSIGRWLALLHLHRTKCIFRSRDSNGFHDFLRTLLLEHLKNFSGPHLGRKFNSWIMAAIDKVIKVAPNESKYGLCHGDFTPSNVMYDCSCRASTVIDFEDAHVGYQMKDLAMFSAKLKLFKISMPEFEDTIDELEAEFLKGYIDINGPLGPDFNIMQFAFLLRVSGPIKSYSYVSILRNASSYIRRLRYKRLLNTEFSKTISCLYERV